MSYTPPSNDSADFAATETSYSAPSNDSADSTLAFVQIGTARIDAGGTVYDVPIYDTGSLSGTWLRARVNSTVGALHTINKTGERLRVRKDSTIYGVKTE